MDFFPLNVSVDFVGWEMFGHLLGGLTCPSKDVSLDQQLAPVS